MEPGDAWLAITQLHTTVVLLGDTLKRILMDCLTPATCATKSSGQKTVSLSTKENFINIQTNKS